MQKSKNEIERKSLNKKLLKSTFLSEIKNIKVNYFKIFIDISTIFIAYFAAYLIGELFSVSSFLIRLGIVFIIGTVIDLIIRKIAKIAKIINKN